MSAVLDNIIAYLQETEQMHERIAKENLNEKVRKLQAWQTNRLLTTHQDLWSSKRFHPAMQFFIDEIYGPKDFSQRDQQLAKVVPKMAKIIPEKALISLEAALQLNRLSLELDLALVHALGEQHVNRNSYFESYRGTNSKAQREEQIRLLETLGLDLAEVVKIPGISAILMLSRKPAKVAGVESLHAFLERGFKSFKKLGNVNDFIFPIISREKQMMKRLFCAANEDENPLP